ncbi:MAG: hypothetical protein AAB267_03135, partial [Candidatus Desantisbacteria bacterium]
AVLSSISPHFRKTLEAGNPEIRPKDFAKYFEIFHRGKQINPVNLENKDNIYECVYREILKARIEDITEANIGSFDKLINNSLQSYLFRRDTDYAVVENDKGEKAIQLIRIEGNKRISLNTRYQNGLHQALEAKENVEIRPDAPAIASTTFSAFLRKYKGYSGLTATAETDAITLAEVYKLQVVGIPSYNPSQRVDLEDKVCGETKAKKYQRIVRDIVEPLALNREIEKAARLKGIDMSIPGRSPILLGTIDDLEVDVLADMLLAMNRKGRTVVDYCELMDVTEDVSALSQEIDSHPDNVYIIRLKSTNTHREQKAIALAGKKNVVTISPIIGRGTDIKVDEFVKIAGLCVIGTEHARDVRIDLQLRGRAGRWGAKGSSVFYVSAEDSIFAPETQAMLKRAFRAGFNERDLKLLF